MFSKRIRPGYSAILLLCGIATLTTVAVSQEDNRQPTAPDLKFVRAFSSPRDIKVAHDILNRTLDIVAGPADPVSRVDTLKTPVAVTTDLNQRVFVADTGAKAVHMFDFNHSKYAQVDAAGNRLNDPVALATDAQNNLYVVDQIGRSILIYDSAGKYRRTMGKLGTRESYFESPTSIAIDHAAGRIYVCDRLGQTVFILDQRGKVLRRIGKRGGGQGPAEFRLPSEVALNRNEILVLDGGNKRIQILDLTGRFLRAFNIGYSGHGAGLAADREGKIYVSDPGLNQIQVYGRDGRLLHTIDVTAMKGADLASPSALWIDAAGRLYMIDSQNNRVAELEFSSDQG
jgi:DNA-binding beta-propeller fold protein YncE